MIKMRLYFSLTMINKHIQVFNLFLTVIVVQDQSYGWIFYFKNWSYVNSFKHDIYMKPKSFDTSKLFFFFWEFVRTKGHKSYFVSIRNAILPQYIMEPKTVFEINTVFGVPTRLFNVFHKDYLCRLNDN